MNMKWNLFPLLALLAALTACGKNSGQDVSITRLKPPVKEVAGATLAGASVASSKSALVKLTVGSQAVSGSSVKDRFFSGGPTDILRILGDVDSRLAEIETRAKDGDHTCLSGTPIPTQLPLFGEAVDFNFQCFQTLDPNGILLFGKKDNTWSIYTMIGAGPVAAKATDLGNGKTEVEIWGGVGYGNAPSWDAGSYTGFHLKANNDSQSLEMTAGGIGVGFCGVTLKADGTNIYAYGSEDGMGGACGAISSSCVLLSDLATPGACSAIDENNFVLTGLGRVPATGSNSGNIPATWSASSYPASGPTLILSGASNDMLNFGIHTSADVPVGVGAF